MGRGGWGGEESAFEREREQEKRGVSYEVSEFLSFRAFFFALTSSRGYKKEGKTPIFCLTCTQEVPQAIDTTGGGRMVAWRVESALVLGR